MNYVIFNELSFPFKNKYLADNGLKTFVKTFASAAEMGLSQLRLHKTIGQNLYNLELAPGYLVSHWLRYGSNTRGAENDDIRVRFKEILTSAPLITWDEPVEKDKDERSSFKISIDGETLRTADGLGAAFLLETIAVSFLSKRFWDNHQIKNLVHYYLKDDGAITVDTVSVNHASTPEHMAKHSTLIQDQKLQSLKEARELWERRHEFFPNLVLCGQVEKQIKTGIGIRSRYFGQIIDRLKSLDVFAGEWKKGGFNDKVLKQYGLDVSGESVFTMRKYGRERRFKLPDGRREFFEKHIKTGELRFHFYPDIREHKIYVGYIGPHLRTVSN